MQDVIQLLEQLANKLGVAVEYLWTTLVRQQIAEGVTDVICAVGWLGVMIFAISITPCFAKFAGDKYEALRRDRLENHTGFNGSAYVSSYREDCWHFIATVGPIAAVIIGALAGIFTVTCLSCGIQQLINPDYFALQEILDTIKSTVQ